MKTKINSSVFRVKVFSSGNKEALSYEFEKWIEAVEMREGEGASLEIFQIDSTGTSDEWSIFVYYKVWRKVAKDVVWPPIKVEKTLIYEQPRKTRLPLSAPFKTPSPVTDLEVDAR